MKTLVFVMLFFCGSISAQVTLPSIEKNIQVNSEGVSFTLPVVLKPSFQTINDSIKVYFNIQGDFSGLQANILALLRNTLNKHEECGERLSVNSSRLTPHVTKARLEMSIRFQKWTCIELFGRDHPNKLFSQSGDLTFLLTPEFDKSQLILSPELESINASGLMSPILESDYMKDKVQEVLERDVSGKLKLLLPEELSNVEVSRIEFKNANGQLHLILNSHIIVSSEEFLSLINKIRND